MNVELHIFVSLPFEAVRALFQLTRYEPDLGVFPSPLRFLSTIAKNCAILTAVFSVASIAFLTVLKQLIAGPLDISVDPRRK
ncbi:hypothetical protein O9K51_03305 [Purpureocillium lavendulum]|uniref:Uncharacterized protein n=1 Tax=Purpureocillium lavendulum TaxID=1247861 RepID=A0AB34G197_9HYPO|nr:hypothetical protein O9K51_03305 [Purpureocillium lavendulum]